MSNLPVTTPGESLAINPESLEVANCYLQNPDIKKVSELLDIPPETVSQILDRREVRNYVNSIFFSTGFNNRHSLRDLMDTIIKKKLQELDENDMGSNRDITEIIALSHKISMEQMATEIQLEKIRSANTLKQQTNIQVNDMSGGSKYGALIEQLIKGASTGTEILDV